MVFIKRFIPEWFLKFIRPFYHGAVALFYSLYYGNPSRKLVVIGITGTAGKSTTAAILSHILNVAGKKCGYMTTVDYFDGQTHFINKHGLSMPGGKRLQKQLSEIVKNGCKYAVVEATSEGLAQNRHLGINFTVGLMTNISPAHVEAHGSFENYRAAKTKLFKKVKIIGVNLDSQSAEYFLRFNAEKKFGVTFKGLTLGLGEKVYRAENFSEYFEIEKQKFELLLPGEFNRYNAALAVASANVLGVGLKEAFNALKEFKGISGRMEEVKNNKDIRIIVDYGCEPVSIRAALKAAAAMPHRRLIHVFGATGGHRDKFKRGDFGKASAEFADVSIITNDDVYDSDPQEIAQAAVAGINQVLKKAENYEYKIILDRKEAIKLAIQTAQPKDLILITGKGSEQFLVLPNNRRIDWDDRSVVREILNSI